MARCRYLFNGVLVFEVASLEVLGWLLGLIKILSTYSSLFVLAGMVLTNHH